MSADAALSVMHICLLEHLQNKGAGGDLTSLATLMYLPTISSTLDVSSNGPCWLLRGCVSEPALATRCFQPIVLITKFASLGLHTANTAHSWACSFHQVQNEQAYMWPRQYSAKRVLSVSTARIYP